MTGNRKFNSAHLPCEKEVPSRMVGAAMAVASLDRGLSRRGPLQKNTLGREVPAVGLLAACSIDQRVRQCRCQHMRQPLPSACIHVH